jgi:hypothetical protein
MLQLKLLVKNDSVILPNFIDTRVPEHHQAFKLMSGHIWYSLQKCCVKKFLSYYEIDCLSDEIFIVINEIRHLSSDEIYYLIWRYVLKRTKEYESAANELEMYESAQNFNRLHHTLTDIKFDDIDE